MNYCSVVIPTYNRLPYLKKCISSILESDFANYEIIVVNDGSSDGTREYLDGLSKDKIRVFHHEQNTGVSQARNTGIRLAKHDLVAFTDDDCLVSKEWITNLINSFTDSKTGFAIGQTFYVQKDYRGYFPERLVSNLNAKWPMGCNIAFRKGVFQKIGFWDGNFDKYSNEDTEIALRAIKAGFTLIRCPDAIVRHQAINWTVRSLLRSARNASVWVPLKKKYPDNFLTFGPPIKYKAIINPEDYLYLLILPVFIPLLLLRYLMHGKRDFQIFFAKWPIYLFLRRYYIWKETILNKVVMF